MGSIKPADDHSRNHNIKSAVEILPAVKYVGIEIITSFGHVVKMELTVPVARA